METGGAGVLITRGTRVVETFGAGVLTLVIVVETRVVVTFGAGVMTTGGDVVVTTLVLVDVVTGAGGGGGSVQAHFNDLISSSMYLNSHESARTIHLCQIWVNI